MKTPRRNPPDTGNTSAMGCATCCQGKRRPDSDWGFVGSDQAGHGGSGEGTALTNHSTFVDIAGRLVLANEDDPHYAQSFDNAAEYFAFVERLIVDGNKHFGTNYQMANVRQSDEAGMIEDDN